MLPNGIITTIAGNPKLLDYSSDGTPAAGSYIFAPRVFGIAADGALYVPDAYVNTVRKIAPPDSATLDGRLIVPSSDGTTAAVFDSQGRHGRTVDAVTSATLYSFQYDTAGRLVAIADAYGNTTTIERDAAGNATAIVSPFGSRTVLSISNGLLASVSNPAGERFEMTYTADRLLTKIRNPRGIEKSIGYDTLGRLVSETRADGGGLTIAGPTDVTGSFQVSVRSGEGQMMTHDIQRSATGDDLRTDTEAATQLKVTTLRKADGSQSITLPDGSSVIGSIRGDPRFSSLAPLSTTSVNLPSGRRMTFSIDRSVTLSNRFDPLSVRSLTQTLSLNGKLWQSSYTSANRTVVSRSPVGRQLATVLNSQGDPVSLQPAGLAAAALSYNSRGQLISIQQGSRHAGIDYNANGLIERVTDPMGRSTEFIYDQVGRVTQKTLPDGRYIGFSYDSNGNLTSVTPPSRAQHLFAFTAIDLEESYTPPSLAGSGITRYSYNKDRQLMLITRPDSSTIGFGYDGAGRLSAIVSALGTHSYSYDAVGRLVKITAPDESALTFTYDGALITGVSAMGPVAGTVTYTYNADLHEASESVNGAAINFGYDADGLLTSAGALTLTRSAENGLLSGTSINTISDSFAYDQFGAINSYTATAAGTSLFSQSYVRDDAGRIIVKTETFAGATNTTSYGYDTAGRLTNVTSSSGTTTYAYDDNGNRLSRITASGSESGTYDAQDRMLTYGGATYTYSANGDLQSKTDTTGTTSYAYDTFGNLRHVTLADGRVIDYVIDSANRRVGKKINGVLVQGWLYSGPQIVAETNGAGVVVSRFVYGSRMNVPDYMIRDGVTYRLIVDQIGSVRLAVNTANGELAAAMNFDEFGRPLTYAGFVPFGFAGGLSDSDTQLIRFGARDYDPATGRWTAKDSLDFMGGDADLYAYVGDDPVNFIDPAGLDALTADPHALAIMASLLRDRAQAGLTPYEQNAQILRDPTSGKYICRMLPSSHQANQNTFKNSPHPWAVAYIHTHPMGRTARADAGSDPAAATSMNLPLYALSRSGIHKYDPADPHPHDTEELNGLAYSQSHNGQDWYDYKDMDSCGCH